MGIRMTINDTGPVTLDELLTQLPNSTAAKEVAKLREDAERWQAIAGCKRVRVLGTAGVLPEHRKEDGYAHIGLELWTRHSHDSEPGAVEMLTTFADIARSV